MFLTRITYLIHLHVGGRLKLVSDIHEHQNRYFQGWEFDLSYNCPQFLNRAFKFAVAELVGDDVAAKFDLLIDSGGAYGEADDGGSYL